MLWELTASVGAMFFNVGLFTQASRIYNDSSLVFGQVLLQWALFTIASFIFVAYYIHLAQYIMAGVSTLGALCCLYISYKIISYKPIQQAQQ